MSNYTTDARRLLKEIGGKENIQAVTHCMTRMRFVLVDPQKADTEKIEQIPTVKGTFTQAGQYQVIIGNDVAQFYQDFVKVSGIEGVSKEQVKAAAGAHQNPLQRALGVLGEIFAPLIPALVCGGLILGFRNIIGEVRFFENGTKTLTDLSVFWAGIYSFLWLIGEAIFHFLPVGITWSITRKMGTTQILGIILGLTLISPQLLNGFAVASTPAADIPVWDFGIGQIQMIGYQGQVIAAILAGFVLVYLERFFTKIFPEVIRMVFVPFFALVPSVLIAHAFVGPIGWAIGDWIASGVYAGLSSSFRTLFAALFGFLYAPVVMTGLHHMTNAIDSQLINQFQGTILWPMIALSNIAQGSAVLGMILLQRKNARAQQVNVPACISCYLGVTEPALFGVNMKYGFPLICGMIGSSLAAMLCVGTGVTAISIGVGGLPGILSIYSQYWGMFALAMLIAIIVPIALVWFIGNKKLSLEQRGSTAVPSGAWMDKRNSSSDHSVADEEVTQTDCGEPDVFSESANRITVYAPLSGEGLALSEVSDEVFSKEVLGPGVAVKPRSEVVVAPADATVAMLMPNSGHAIGLQLDHGEEILLHIGIDTVELQGKGFEVFVEEGQKVHRGQKLLQFSKEILEREGYDPTTMCIVTDAKGRALQISDARNWIAGETAIFALR